MPTKTTPPTGPQRTAHGPSSHLERLLALTMTLLYRRHATVATLASSFGVTERTIFRDLALLDAAGLPLVSSPGRGGGIGLAKGFRLEQQLFSPAALGVWSQSLRALSDLSGDPSLEHDADRAEGLLADSASSTEVIDLRWDHPATDAAKPFLHAAAQAIRQSRVLDIAYRDREGAPTRRTIEPLRLVHSGGSWFLQAWCRLRAQYRVFRVQRIASWATGSDTFERMDRLRGLPTFDPLVDSPAPPSIHLALHRPSPDLLAYLGHPRIALDAAGRCELEIQWPVDGWLVRWLCGQAPEVEVLHPPSLREDVSRRLETARSTYSREVPQP